MKDSPSNGKHNRVKKNLKLGNTMEYLKFIFYFVCESLNFLRS